MPRKVGRVFSRESHQPIEGARLLFTREDGFFSTSAISDELGRYAVELPTGRFRTRIAHPDFVDRDSFTPGFVAITPGRQAVANFFLHSRGDSLWIHADGTPGLADNDAHLGFFFDAPRMPLVGDFDGDGRDELAFTRRRSGSAGNDFWCLKADPRHRGWNHLGSPQGSGRLAFDASSAGVAAAFGVVGDFDGDGRDEIALKIADSGSRGNDFWAMDYDPRRRRWQHMSRIGGHSAGADFDCSASGAPARFAVAGDFDGDGRDEIAVGIDAPSSSGNDLWVMAFDPARRRWRHLSPISGHSRGADLDCSGTPDEARFAVAGDFDGDGVDELAVAIKSAGSRGNDFWIMRFNPNRGRWSHLSPIPNHPTRADLDCGGSDAFAAMAIAADFNNDGRDELVVAARRRGTALNDLWAMSFDPDRRQWRHMSRIQGHPVGADIDPSGERIHVRSLHAADVDGDGVPELIVAPEASGSRSNDLWAFKFDHVDERWHHLSPSGGPSNVDLDMSTSGKQAGFVATGLFEVGAADRRAEVVASIDDSESLGLANPNFWVMRYAPSRVTRTSASGRLLLITESSFEPIGTRRSAKNVTLELQFDSGTRTVRILDFPTLSDTFEVAEDLENTTTVTLLESSVGVFDPDHGTLSGLDLRLSVVHSLPLAGDSTLELTLSTFGRLPARHGGMPGSDIDRVTGNLVAVGEGLYTGGILGDSLAFALARLTLASLPF